MPCSEVPFHKLHEDGCGKHLHQVWGKQEAVATSG